MSEHPIEGLMLTAMDSIRDMVDVNTIIGEPIETSNNVIIIPISKVGFGFAAGGSEFNEETITEYNKKDKDEMIQYKLPFGGGSGAGVSITPVAFLVIEEKGVKLLPVSHSSTLDKLLDYVPDLMEKMSNILSKEMNCKKTDKKDEIKRKDKKDEREIKEPKTQILENDNTVIIPNTTKIQKYEFEYDEADNISDEIEDDEE